MKSFAFQIMSFNSGMEQPMNGVVEFEDRRSRVLVRRKGWLTSSGRSVFRIRDDG